MTDNSNVARNEAVVREMIAGWDSRDLAAIMNTFADDIVWHNIPTAPIEGKEAVKAMAEPFVNACTLIEFKIIHLQGAGDRVFTERVDCLELGGNLLELPVAGTFDINADGKICGWRDYFDMQTWLDQGGPPFG